MIQIKTYGIIGLMEWHGQITSGGIKMKIDFTNGGMTAYGTTPATFTTKHKLTQHIIENSNEFKSGRIYLVSKTDIAEESDNKNNANSQVVKVADKAEAIEWLKENYPDKGYTAFKLRSKEAFDSACAECNVVFDIQA